MSEYYIEYDDLFVFAPSYLILESADVDGIITEGKSLGTAKLADLSLKSAMNELVGPIMPNYAKQRVVGRSVGRKKLIRVQNRVRVGLLTEIARYQFATIDEIRLRARTKKLMSVAWRDVFMAGVRASGKPGLGKGSKALVHLSAGDDNWLRGAMKHETTFLNKFMTAIVDETYSMTLDRRVEMYVRSLAAFYDTARVIGMPDDIAIHWLGPHDKITCVGCRYLFDNSPYTKYTIPTVPKAGLTPCLTNCRDRLLVRRVGMDAVVLMNKSGKKRDQHIRKLRILKRRPKKI